MAPAMQKDVWGAAGKERDEASAIGCAIEAKEGKTETRL